MTNSKRKISRIQIARRIVQILGLILLPGTYILAFSGIRNICLAILTQNSNLAQIILEAVEVIAVIPITILFGRFFCGWLCAFGTFNDIIYLFSSKVLKIKFKINEKLDLMLKSLKYILLLFIIYFIWIKGSELLDSASPWDAFAQIPNFGDAIVQYTIGSILLIFIVIGAMFVERFFCRYLCPLGAILAITSKLRIFNISKKRDKCGKCRLCTNNCSMGISMYKHDKIASGECIYCFKCLDACPRDNTKVQTSGKHVNAGLAACIAIGGFILLFSGTSVVGKNIAASAKQSVQSNSSGNLQTDNSTDSNKLTNNNVSSKKNNLSNDSASTNDQQQKYKDGTYTGTGKGYRSGLKVEVTIKNSKISDIQIVSDNETPRFADKAFPVVPNEIVQAQSTEVDGVSGATRSSNGIKRAVNDALSKAKI